MNAFFAICNDVISTYPIHSYKSAMRSLVMRCNVFFTWNSGTFCTFCWTLLLCRGWILLNKQLYFVSMPAVKVLSVCFTLSLCCSIYLNTKETWSQLSCYQGVLLTITWPRRCKLSHLFVRLWNILSSFNQTREQNSPFAHHSLTIPCIYDPYTVFQYVCHNHQVEHSSTESDDVLPIVKHAYIPIGC